MDSIYKNIEEYNLNKKHKTLIAFDDMIADMLSNKHILNTRMIQIMIIKLLQNTIQIKNVKY